MKIIALGLRELKYETRSITFEPDQPFLMST